MTTPDSPDKLLFDVLTLDLSQRMVRSISAAVEIARDSGILPADIKKSFMTALLVDQANIIHELIGATLVESTFKPSTASPELRLLAALAVHYTVSGASHPFTTALEMVRKMGHEIPETLIFGDDK